jgi:hypothetical protein
MQNNHFSKGLSHYILVENILLHRHLSLSRWSLLVVVVWSVLRAQVGSRDRDLLPAGAWSGRAMEEEDWSLAMAARVSTFAVGCWLLAY